MQDRRVVILGLDGAMGPAVREADTPNIDAVAAAGVVTYTARTVVPSASFEAWGAMFHGVGPDKHRIDGDHPCGEDVPWPSFAKVLHEQRPTATCASFSCWEPINSRILEPSCPCERVSLPDPQLVAAATQYIRRTPPHLLFMQLDFIDGAGHREGYGTRAYLEQITATDRLVGDVLSAVREAGVWEDTLIILLSDHGGEGTSHGSDHPDCLTTFWAASGPGVTAGEELKASVHIADTAPVVARFLGLDAPAGWDAHVPEGVFVD